MSSDYDFYHANRGKVMSFKTTFHSHHFSSLEKLGQVWTETTGGLVYQCIKVRVVGYALAKHGEFILYQHPGNETIGDDLMPLISDCELYETDQLSLVSTSMGGRFARCFSIKLHPYEKVIKSSSDRYPNRCPVCGSKAYIGMKEIECSFSKCKHFR